MNEQRRQFLKGASIALFPAVAGCTDQTNGSESGPDDTEQDSTPEDQDDTTETPEMEAGTTTEDEMTSGPSALVLDNVGVRAWEVTEDGSGTVAPLNEENPTLTLEIGQRYTVENRGWDAHPFAFRSDDDTPLLSQSTDGQFGDDSAVDWMDDGETFAFTFTEELAAAVDYYVCTVHPGMRASVETR